MTRVAIIDDHDLLRFGLKTVIDHAEDMEFVERKNGDIDPTVFVDDDGKAYMFWGYADLYIARLNDDMVSLDKWFVPGDPRSPSQHVGVVEFLGKNWVFGYNYQLYAERTPAPRMVIATIELRNERPGEIITKRFEIPRELTEGKERVMVCFRGKKGTTWVGAVFSLAIVK